MLSSERRTIRGADRYDDRTPWATRSGARGSAGAPASRHAWRARSSPDRIIDAIRQALVALDEKLRVIAANRAFYRAFAVMPEETIGQHLIEVGDHRLDVPAVRDFVGLLLSEAAIEDYEIEIELPALGRRVLLLSAEKIRGEAEGTCEIVVAIDDVTEHKRAETILKSAKWHAERANLSKSRFLAAASHDLRQPLQTLSLVRGILAKKIKDKSNEEALMLVARLNETADALLGMLDTLLDINQLETGSVRPEKVDFPINDLLERLRIEFAYHARAHDLIWHVVPCRLSIRSDPRLLEQMIRNLLSNAVNHTERGKIVLGCRRRGDKLRIEVWDTGTGIPREQLRAIFEEYHQLGNPVRQDNRGFGLGLSIVQRLGNLLGHSVDVQSRPGKGSVFAVEVPLGGKQPSLPRRRRSSEVRSQSRHAAILVVEADPRVREMLALLFTREGHRTAAVADGKQAVALTRGTIKPDIVVAGYSLPNGMTGLQVIAGVSEALGRELPAVILTGDISPDTMREITQRGCVQRYRPVRAKELTHLIQSLLAECGGRRCKWARRRLSPKTTYCGRPFSSLTTKCRSARRCAGCFRKRGGRSRSTRAATQVVEMVVDGNPNKQIAYVLNISQRTVETHRATAMKKLGARTLSELIHLTIAGSTHVRTARPARAARAIGSQ